MFVVGTSGFSYKDWRGPFYPKGIQDRDMLGFYAERFPMVEINSSYYSIPSTKSVQAMVSKVPERASSASRRMVISGEISIMV